MPGPSAKYAVKGANWDQLVNSWLVEMGQIANHFEPEPASINSRGCCLRQGGEMWGGKTAMRAGEGEEMPPFFSFKPRHHDFWIEL